MRPFNDLKVNGTLVFRSAYCKDVGRRFKMAKDFTLIAITISLTFHILAVIIQGVPYSTAFFLRVIEGLQTQPAQISGSFRRDIIFEVF